MGLIPRVAYAVNKSNYTELCVMWTGI